MGKRNQKNFHSINVTLDAKDKFIKNDTFEPYSNKQDPQFSTFTNLSNRKGSAMKMKGIKFSAQTHYGNGEA